MRGVDVNAKRDFLVVHVGISFSEPVMVRGKREGRVGCYGGVYVDSAQGLQVNRIRVRNDFTHECPRYFEPGAKCSGPPGGEGCNVESVLDSEFDMFAYEEEFWFMK